MSKSSETEKEVPSLWQYVPIADYNLPVEPVQHAAKKNLLSLRQLLRLDKQEAASALKTDDDLLKLPHWQLERLAPAPDWRSAAETLGDHLQDWLEQDNPDQPVIVLVGPPYSGHAAILDAWAEQERWHRLNPPTTEQILADDDGWLSEQNESNGRWVFPHLEKAYLRQAAGLSLIRRFLDCVFSGDLGRGIIGCDSWAWAFLSRVWQRQQIVPLTLQAWHEEQLTRLIQTTAVLSDNRQIAFRQSDNGHYLFPPPDTDEAENSVELSNFLQLLAAYSRGNLGVAWSIWQNSLQAEPDESLDEDIAEEDQQLPQQTIWVPPWDHLQQLALPPDVGRDQAFVLHALLLHNGLPPTLLQQLMPLSPSQTAETIFQLKAAELIVVEDEGLRVSPRGYPAVRQFLKSNGYLVDQF